MQKRIGFPYIGPQQGNYLLSLKSAHTPFGTVYERSSEIRIGEDRSSRLPSMIRVAGENSTPFQPNPLSLHSLREFDFTHLIGYLRFVLKLVPE